MSSSSPGPRPSRPHSDIHRFWHRRGYLPHFDAGAVVQSITFRLADSLPRHVHETIVASSRTESETRARIEALIDHGRGACVLRRTDCAGIVENALKYFDGSRYRLLAWVIMPNHVHVLIEQIEGHRLSDVVHSWKTLHGVPDKQDYQAKRSIMGSGLFRSLRPRRGTLCKRSKLHRVQPTQGRPDFARGGLAVFLSAAAVCRATMIYCSCCCRSEMRPRRPRSLGEEIYYRSFLRSLPFAGGDAMAERISVMSLSGKRNVAKLIGQFRSECRWHAFRYTYRLTPAGRSHGVFRQRLPDSVCRPS